MPTKMEQLAAALRGTMPAEPSVPLGAAVDAPLRFYTDALTTALIGTTPVVSIPNPPGGPQVPPVLPVYPAPLVPDTGGPHLAAASTGALPSPADAVKCQIHVDGAGDTWVFNGTAWKKLQYAP